MRLSFMRFFCLFVLSALFAAGVAEAKTYEYTLATDAEDMAESGWGLTLSSSSNGYYFNSTAHRIDSVSFQFPITNVVINGYCNSTRALKYTSTLGDSVGIASTSGTVASDILNMEYAASDNVTSFSVVNVSGKGYYYIKKITVSTLDPPPALGEIDDQEIGSENSLSLKLDVDTFDGDELTFDCAGLLLPEMSNLAADSYGVEKIGDDYYLCFSPQTAGITAGTVSFTLSVTGKGGRSNIVSFDCAVTQGVVKTPPSVDEIDAQSVLALRTLTVPFTVREADGDAVTTNAVCKTDGVAGIFGLNEAGAFFYTPDMTDIDLSPVSFEIQATDPEGKGTASFTVAVAAGMPPAIGEIADQTVNFGGQLKIKLPITATDGDEITLTNVVCQEAAGVVSPVTDMVFTFDPVEADIGKTLPFSVTAADFDGSATVPFNVSVGLAAPVALRCGGEDWNRTSFKADIEAEIPGAESYVLRVICDPESETPITNDIENAVFPYVVSGLTADSCAYCVKAVRGAASSDWSNKITIDLADYNEPVYAIPMTGSARGVYRNDFNALPLDSSVWYDTQTMPGWYAATDKTSLDGAVLAPSNGGTESGLLAFYGFSDDSDNHAFGLRSTAQAQKYNYGVVFTNMCDYAVTNIHVSFTTLELHQYSKECTLKFYYGRGLEFVPMTSANVNVPALDYVAPKTGNSTKLNPPEIGSLSADIPFEGEEALLPGEVIAFKWALEGSGGVSSLGIDDLEVKWECKFPVGLVFFIK